MSMEQKRQVDNLRANDRILQDFLSHINLSSVIILLVSLKGFYKALTVIEMRVLRLKLTDSLMGSFDRSLKTYLRLTQLS